MRRARFLPAVGSRPEMRLALAALALLAGCYPSPPPPPAIPPPAALPVRVTQHVVIISIDGLRHDAVERVNAPTLRRLTRTGAHSARAETILPSLTLPSHTSMLTGVRVEEHGVTWNTNLTGRYGTVRVPTVLELARAAGLRTAAFMGKRKLKHLLREGSLDWVSYPRAQVILLADEVAAEVTEYLEFKRPNLLFIHLPDPDVAGHGFGWMSRPYRAAVRRADAAVAHIERSLQRAFGDDYVLIVTSDHGGSGRGHRGGSEIDLRIPWIASGRGVVAGEIGAPIRTYDTAATALWLLGLAPPVTWAGTPVRGAFGDNGHPADARRSPAPDADEARR